MDWAGEEGAFVGALCAVGFLDGEPGSYQIHDWSDHNAWAAGSKRRSEVAKENAAKKWGYTSDSDGQTNAQKRSARLAEARRKGTHTPGEWEAMKNVCGNACVECGATHLDLSKDHILAVAKGGSDAIDNIQPMCHRCNAGKGANGSDKRPPRWREMLDERLQNACKTPANESEMSAPSPSPSPSPSLNPKPQSAAFTEPEVDATPSSPPLASPIGPDQITGRAGVELGVERGIAFDGIGLPGQAKFLFGQLLDQQAAQLRGVEVFKLRQQAPGICLWHVHGALFCQCLMRCLIY